MKTKPKKPARKRRGAVPCPKCHSPFSDVLRTSPVKNGLRRVRRCDDCRHEFQTREAVALEKVTDVSPELAAIATRVTELNKLVFASPLFQPGLQQSPSRTS